MADFCRRLSFSSSSCPPCLVACDRWMIKRRHRLAVPAPSGTETTGHLSIYRPPGLRTNHRDHRAAAKKR
jgi:hypothetical protein